MPDLNRRLPRIDASRFSMVPRADIPRSTFVTTHSVKSTFDANYLIPIHIDEVLPGDVHQGRLTIFARMATPVFPIMDELTIETFFFYVPCRLLWTNWKKFMGERANPADSISYTIPAHNLANGTVSPLTLHDYMGIPPGTTQTADTVNALPFRAYYLIWNDWFRDQNLQNSLTIALTDGPDAYASYVLQKRNKKHDYFTSALPWPLKGGVEVQMPLLGQAHVKGLAIKSPLAAPIAGAPLGNESGGTVASAWPAYWRVDDAERLYVRAENTGANSPPVIYADLSTATGATINAMRMAVQTQRLLERDARSGTRYTELLRAHFGVMPEDMRLQRPEYIGGGRTPIQTSAIPQTSATTITGSASPLGAVGAAATASDQHSFSYNATEHGYIIGLANVRGELTYQQGLHRLWTRQTRYDFYWPAFAHLGEQIIRNDEIYWVSQSALNDDAFGYQERWAEYRHRPSRISGLFRSTAAGNIDEWHVAQQFPSLPALNSTFITEDLPLSRVLAAGLGANGVQILFDSVFKIKTTRAMPMFSVPGMMDHF